MTVEQYITLNAPFESRGENIAQRASENYDALHAALGIGDELLELMLEIEASSDEEDRLGLFNEKIIKEAGDILWYIAILCRKYELTIDMNSDIANSKPLPSITYAVQSLMSIIKKHIYYGKELDLNAVQFYINVIARKLVKICTQPLDEIMGRNYAKLSVRYGVEFDPDKAINKNEAVE